ncbi:unnamed protein product [Meloidogyne enterolobii]|uniref:Uncharacterized protein n=1 Tax=Meloidogyne enterolobii TaxID=390850 RepID=A0ACB1ANX2_MELEN
MGIVDVLLTSLAHFSRQPNRLEPLHPAIAEEQPMLCFERCFAYGTFIQAFWDITTTDNGFTIYWCQWSCWLWTN